MNQIDVTIFLFILTNFKIVEEIDFKNIINLKEKSQVHIEVKDLDTFYGIQENIKEAQLKEAQEVAEKVNAKYMGFGERM